MKNEHEEIRALFDTLSPDGAQKERMMKNISVKKESGRTKRLPVKYAVAAVLAAVLAGTGCVYAAVPAVREYINLLFLREDSVTRLKEVPEGWIGVYTVEDLEAVREDLGGYYILMNNIVIPEEYYQSGGIYEDGFVPIGDNDTRRIQVKDENGHSYSTEERDTFVGIFNGNGYTISNVHITNPVGTAAGLFGTCGILYDIWDPQTGETFRKSGGIIKNLGVINSSVIITDDKDYSTENKKNFTDEDDYTEVKKANYTDVSIGMIAGKGAYVVSPV